MSCNIIFDLLLKLRTIFFPRPLLYLQHLLTGSLPLLFVVLLLVPASISAQEEGWNEAAPDAIASIPFSQVRKLLKPGGALSAYK